MATSLDKAATAAYSQLEIQWAAGTLLAAVNTFNAAVIAIFATDGSTAERTVSDWCVPGVTVATQLAAATPVTLTAFAAAAGYVNRICWAGFFAKNATPARITNAQAVALLAAFNAAFP